MRKLPSGEEEYELAYDYAMDQIQEQAPKQAQLAKQALSWITHAKRPLTSTELQQALATRPGDSDFNKEGITLIRDLVSICARLVTVNKQSSIAQLVHYTTQQYFHRTKAR